MQKHTIQARIIQYILGNVVATFGAVVIIRSSLGPAAFDVLFVHLKLTTPLTLGTAAFVFQGLIILFVTISRKNLRYLISFSSVLIAGIALDFWDLIALANYNPTSIWVRLISYPIGIYILTLGLAIISTTKIAAVSFDELMYLLMDWFKTKQVFWIRLAIEGTGLTLGLIVGLIGGIGFGEMTIASIVIVFVFPLFLQWQYAFLAKLGFIR
jgi:Predicted membrane protein